LPSVVQGNLEKEVALEARLLASSDVALPALPCIFVQGPAQASSEAGTHILSESLQKEG
jgi:hypothetical protein